MRKILMAIAATAVLAAPAAYAQEGTAAGVAGGAATGAVLGGPVGAIIGATAGAVIGTMIDPPPPVKTYVVSEKVPSVQVTGEIEVGATLPEVVELHAIPDYEYKFAVINDTRVLVDPKTRQIVYIFT